MALQPTWGLSCILILFRVAVLVHPVMSLEISDVLGAGGRGGVETSGGRALGDPVAMTHGSLEGNLGAGVPFGSGAGAWDVDTLAMEEPDFSLNGQWDPPPKSARIMDMKGARSSKREEGAPVAVEGESRHSESREKEGGAGGKQKTPRSERQLDGQFAQYAVQVVFVSMVEDFDVSKQVTRDFYMNEVARVYREVCREEGLQEDVLKKKEKEPGVFDFPRGKYLTDPPYFAAYVHAQLKVAAWYLPDQRARERAMQRVGRRLFDMARAYLDLDSEISNSAGAPSFSLIRKWLKSVVRKIVTWGYFADAGVTWRSGAENDWSNDGTASFTFWYKGAVMLHPSASGIREMPALEQELASRMIEAFFMSLAIDVTNEEPKSFLKLLEKGAETGWEEAAKEKVKERWTIQSM